MEALGRLFRPPKGSFFLFGPRGTGKTTYLAEAFPHALRIDLLSPATHRAFLARPERLEDLVAEHRGGAPVVVDEVQKAPQLLEVVHRLMDADPKRVFVMTGSSARKLRRGGVDMLAGRAVPASLHPFMAAELGDRFSLEDSLRLGMVPLVLGAQDPAATLAAYVSVYLKEEVTAEGIVRNTGDFARFLEAISFSHASVLNTAEVARECQVGRKTVEGYVGILEDLLLGFRVPVFSRRAKRTLISHAKFYYFDCGVFRSVRPAGPLDRPGEAEGAAVEGLVAQHLKAWAAYRQDRERVHFWRTKSGMEVDFVVYGGDTFAAVEVKNARKVDRVDTRSLREFASDYPEAKTCLVYRGAERIRVAGVPCVPCAKFLAELHPDRPLL
jgi:predicted AAA+ superfamily ATPase